MRSLLEYRSRKSFIFTDSHHTNKFPRGWSTEPGWSVVHFSAVVICLVWSCNHSCSWAYHVFEILSDWLRTRVRVALTGLGLGLGFGSIADRLVQVHSSAHQPFSISCARVYEHVVPWLGRVCMICPRVHVIACRNTHDLSTWLICSVPLCPTIEGPVVY